MRGLGRLQGFLAQVLGLGGLDLKVLNDRLRIYSLGYTVWFLVGNGGMDYGDYSWGLYRDWYRDPFPHSLLSTRQQSSGLGPPGLRRRSSPISGTPAPERSGRRP